MQEQEQEQEQDSVRRRFVILVLVLPLRNVPLTEIRVRAASRSRSRSRIRSGGVGCSSRVGGLFAFSLTPCAAGGDFPDCLENGFVGVAPASLAKELNWGAWVSDKRAENPAHLDSHENVDDQPDT